MERRAPIVAPAARRIPNAASPSPDTPAKAPIKFFMNLDNVSPSIDTPVHFSNPFIPASANAKPPKNPARPIPIPVIPIATATPPVIPFFIPITAPAARRSPNAVKPSTPTPANDAIKLFISLAMLVPAGAFNKSPRAHSAPFSAIIIPPKNPTRPAPRAVIPSTILPAEPFPNPVAAPATRIPNNAPADAAVSKDPRKVFISLPRPVPSTPEASLIHSRPFSPRRIPVKNPARPAPRAVIPAIIFVTLNLGIAAAATPIAAIPPTIAPLIPSKELKKLVMSLARPVPSTSKALLMCLVTKSPARIPAKNPPIPAPIAVIPSTNFLTSVSPNFAMNVAAPITPAIIIPALASKAPKKF